jgi:hypothetical protein
LLQTALAKKDKCSLLNIWLCRFNLHCCSGRRVIGNAVINHKQNREGNAMEIDEHLFSELQEYYNAEKYDYALSVIKKAGMDEITSKAWRDAANIWFHYLAGRVFFAEGEFISAVSSLGAFVHWAKNEKQLEQDIFVHNMRRPSLEEIDHTEKLLEKAKLHLKSELSTLEEFKDKDKIDETIREYEYAWDKFRSGNVKGRCFIATATFESPDSFEVILLRKFRDETLNNYLLGRFFINVYYFLSPPIASLIYSSTFLKKISKSILSRLVSWIQQRNSI